MLLRDIFTKNIIIVLCIIASSQLYGVYLNYKYSDCYVTDFKIVEVLKGGKMKILIKGKKRSREVIVDLDYKYFPEKNSNDKCEQFMFEKMIGEINERITTSNAELKLNYCHRDIKETEGIIFANGKNIIQEMIDKGTIPGRKRLRLVGVNWCEYYSHGVSDGMKNKSWFAKFKEWLMG